MRAAGNEIVATEKVDAPTLHILSENPLDQIWTQLSLWESVNLA